MTSNRKMKVAGLIAGAMAASLICAVPPAAAAGPSAATTRAYDEYLRRTEKRMQKDYQGLESEGPESIGATGGTFIRKESRPPGHGEGGKTEDGNVFVVCVAGCDSDGVAVPGGLIHDWLGVVFIPGVSLRQTLALVQDYNHARDHYAPNVTESRVLSHAGDSWKVFLQLKQTDVVTVVFNTEYDIRYVRLDGQRVYSVSHSTRIAQVEHAGEPRERELPAAQDQGFLWRLDSYWRFEEADGGVYVQCEAISLTRDVPAGLGWLVKPFIRDIPANSLRFTLGAMRDALVRNFPAAGEEPGPPEN